MVELGINTLVRLLVNIAPFMLRLFYKQEQLANKVKIAIRSEGEGVYIQVGQLPSARVWIGITNLTPFTIEVDRIVSKLTYGHQIAKLTSLDRRTIKSTEEETFLLEESLNESQVEALKDKSNTDEARLEIYAFFISKVHNFAINHRYINTRNVQVTPKLADHPGN